MAAVDTFGANRHSVPDRHFLSIDSQLRKSKCKLFVSDGPKRKTSLE